MTLLSICMAIVLSLDFAQAAQMGAVKDADADLLDAPGEKSNMIQKIKKGTQLAISNEPKNGYYKVRLPGGQIGWLPGRALGLAVDKAAGQQPQLPMEEPLEQPEQRKKINTFPVDDSVEMARDERSTPDKAKKKTARKPRFQLRAFGGMNFFSATEANNLIQFDSLSNGFHFGGEAAVKVVKMFWAVARFERMFKSVTGKNTATNKMYDFSLTSLPVSGGIKMSLFDDDDINGMISVLGGLGLSTKLDTTCTGATTTMSANALTLVAKADVDLMISKKVAVFLEAGYRYHKTAKLTPATDATGSEILKLNGVFVPIALDLSGLFAGLGVMFQF